MRLETVVDTNAITAEFFGGSRKIDIHISSMKVCNSALAQAVINSVL